VLDAIFGPGHDVAPLDRAVGRIEPRLRSLLAAVERGHATVDDLTGDLGDAGEVLGGLTELELLGLVRRAAGGRYVRCAAVGREATAG
jgi:predicted Rossmann fold nucleotide-binding protein DprA/Smf involved in DNA uptake